ncbi:RDD family protein [Nocardioides sambongensis]|uniref:RDD family protein n=1 Tax=Nocardioides sambongensis TaxID=2589074 RepID=UPI00112779B8|nr:RDD family protein [Nocardioides sambongensis]
MSTPPTTEFATVTDDDLVTGEGVALDLPPASLGVRMASGLIDVTVTVLLLVVVLVVLSIATIGADAALVDAAVVLLSVVVFAIFPTTLETLTRGRSLGKLALGLRTVRDDGGPITFHHALVRALIGYVEIYAFAGTPAFFSILLSKRGKRLGDYAAGTHVVRERVVLRLPSPAPMPPELAGWAAGADITALPTGLALAIRQFLGRADLVDPVSRDQVARSLAAELTPYVAPAPPRGAPAERVLCAVLAERRERDRRRLAREEELRRRLWTPQG